MTHALMLQGTGSDVGKSLLVAGLCRAYTRRGLKVRPFKPQNMSNNAAVTSDGGEIGRAQALQARACGCAPATDMNPVLLKPQSDVGSQIVVNGRVFGNARASEYYRLKPKLLGHVLESFSRLSVAADLVVVEGAGSASEVNLRSGDIANMGFALAAEVPVALVGDVDRGGVIASIVGTGQLLSAAERKLVTGYIINRFRGDVALFTGAIEIIDTQTGWRCHGVVPFFPDAAHLPAEDSVGVGRHRPTRPDAAIRVAVPVLSRMSNFDDLDPLIAEPDVEVVFIQPGSAIPGDADLIVLPGSKATIADTEFVRRQGWDIDIAAHLRRGGWLLGLCGGYQMLGKTIRDPDGIEGEPGETKGLGCLDVETRLTRHKTLTEAEGIELSTQTPVIGYEMHVGATDGADTSRAFLRLSNHDDGARSDDGKVMGCYLHGLFRADRFRHAFLNQIRQRDESGIAYERRIESALDQLADHLESSLDLDGLLECAFKTRTVSQAVSSPLPPPTALPRR